MRKQGQDYGRGMTTIFFSHDVNPASSREDCVLAMKDGQRVVKMDSIRLLQTAG